MYRSKRIATFLTQALTILYIVLNKNKTCLSEKKDQTFLSSKKGDTLFYNTILSLFQYKNRIVKDFCNIPFSIVSVC